MGRRQVNRRAPRPRRRILPLWDRRRLHNRTRLRRHLRQSRRHRPTSARRASSPPIVARSPWWWTRPPRRRRRDVRGSSRRSRRCAAPARRAGRQAARRVISGRRFRATAGRRMCHRRPGRRRRPICRRPICRRPTCRRPIRQSRQRRTQIAGLGHRLRAAEQGHGRLHRGRRQHHGRRQDVTFDAAPHRSGRVHHSHGAVDGRRAGRPAAGHCRIRARQLEGSSNSSPITCSLPTA